MHRETLCWCPPWCNYTISCCPNQHSVSSFILQVCDKLDYVLDICRFDLVSFVGCLLYWGHVLQLQIRIWPNQRACYSSHCHQCIGCVLCDLLVDKEISREENLGRLHETLYFSYNKIRWQILVHSAMVSSSPPSAAKFDAQAVCMLWQALRVYPHPDVN